MVLRILVAYLYKISKCFIMFMITIEIDSKIISNELKIYVSRFFLSCWLF